MKILMVITGMQSGGAERVMATLCNNLSANHEVRLAIMKGAESDYELSEKVEIVAGKVKGKNLLDSVKFTRRVVNEWKPDIILAFMTKSNIIALMSRLVTKYKCPIIIAERANPFYAGKIFKLMRRFLYPLADGCVFQTLQAQKYYMDRKMLKCKSIVLRNPLNPDFNVIPYEGDRKNKIVTMGRLSVEKNQKMLIEAFSYIADKYPEYSVEIYGDGPLHDELEQSIRQYNMEKRVFLMGRKDNVKEYVKDASIFVLPSNSEGMPNALLEAMALGLPSIATDCPIGGSAVIINDGVNGFLIPMNDAKTLSEKISSLIDNKDLADRFGMEARKVLVDFNTDKVCSQWEEYLISVKK